MSKQETFEEYAKSFHPEQQATLRRDNAYRYMWNHQQSKIDSITDKYNHLDKLTTEQHGKLDSQNLLIEKLLEAVEFTSSEETPYRVHEHKDALEERFHNAIFKAREILNTPMVKDWKEGRAV